MAEPLSHDGWSGQTLTSGHGVTAAALGARSRMLCETWLYRYLPFDYADF